MKKLFLLIALLISVPLYAANKSGSITAAGAACISSTCVQIVVPPGSGTAAVVVGGTFAQTLQFEVSSDGGAVFSSVSAYPITSGASATSATATGAWQINVAGMTHLQVRASAVTSGTATVSISTSAASMGGGGGGASGDSVYILDPTTGASMGSTDKPVVVVPPTADAAEGAAATNPPSPIGIKARATELAAVDAGDEVRPTATLTGIPLNWGPAEPGDTWIFNTVIAGVTDTAWTAIKAGEATYFLCITDIKVQNSHATVGTVVGIYDDDDGDVADSSLMDSGYAASLGGGWRDDLGSQPVYCTATAGNGIYFTAITTGAAVHVHARGFRTKLAQKY
jgi:hypothetical protein